MDLGTREMLFGNSIVSSLMKGYLSSQKEGHLRKKEGRGDLGQKKRPSLQKRDTWEV